jgi:transcriptional regulator with XRE-family HTH domain
VKEDLHRKDYRDAFVEESVKTGIAFQTRALRLDAGWSQKELGKKAGKPQNVISRIEDPDYGNFTIRTLLDLASAFDVALLVRFVSFGQLIQQFKDVSLKALAVPNFEKEQEFYRAAPESALAQIAFFSAKITEPRIPTPEETVFGTRSKLRDVVLPRGQAERIPAIPGER